MKKIIIALCVAVVLLYCFVIRALSKLTVKEQAVNSKLFTVPLVIFTFLYNQCLVFLVARGCSFQRPLLFPSWGQNDKLQGF